MAFQLALSSVVVDVNASFFVQLALLIAVILICKVLIFKPFLKVEAQRHEAIDGKLAQAEALKARVSEAEAQIQQRVAKSEAELAAARREKMAAAQSSKAEILDAAHRECDAVLEAARAEAQGAIEKAQSEIERASGELGTMIGHAVLAKQKQLAQQVAQVRR